MTRLPRFCPRVLPQHQILHRNNREVCFVTDQNSAFHAAWLKEYAQTFSRYMPG